MRQIEAFRETVALARQSPWHTIKEGCSVIHLEDMLSRIEDDQSKAPQHREYSNAKIGRHLGWAQAIVCVYSPLGLTLQTFKDINIRHREGARSLAKVSRIMGQVLTPKKKGKRK